MFAATGRRGPRYAEYYLDNVFEALGTPGEWYLDHRRVTCTTFRWRVNHRRLASSSPLRLNSWSCSEDVQRKGGSSSSYSSKTSGSSIQIGLSQKIGTRCPTSSTLRSQNPYPVLSTRPPRRPRRTSWAHCAGGRRYCSIEDCRVAHIGGYAVEVGEGCEGNRVVGNELTDLEPAG